MQKIILASASERREMLLSQAGFEFESRPSNFDEDSAYNEEFSPYDFVKFVSNQKALTVCETITEPAVIIAADTIISIKGKIMGKPKNFEAAIKMLKSLQGKSHFVYTGVTIIKKTLDGMELRNIVETTTVNMRKLTNFEIESYVNTGEAYDKAGGYAIQEKGSLLIEGIEGDYYNIVGLPLARVYEVMNTLGIDLSDIWKNH